MKLTGFVAGGILGLSFGILVMYATRNFRHGGQHGGALIEMFFGGIVVAILGAFFGLLFTAGRRP